MSGSSYRTILRSSAIIGGAQVINILSGLLKMKVAAVLLGPAGVGLAGLYMNLVQTAASIASLGMGNVGTRQIAAAHAEGGEIAVGRTRRALFWGTMVLALIGGVVFWLASSWITRTVLADASLTSEVAWLSLGVTLSVASGSQSALLTGMRRVGDLARINVGAGLLGAILGVVALWFWGRNGLLAMILVAPLASFILGHIYVARLAPPAGPRAALGEISAQWRDMARLGIPFMFSGLVIMLGQLAARALVQNDLGAEALGQFQAAWAIGMTYLGFVLGAMGTDYYPRLTAVINDHATAVRLVNEQTEVALLLCAPVLLAMLGLAPWVIRLLYSNDFGPAVDILRWQLLGDILKVMSWPLGFVLLARGAGKTFIFTETTGIATFVLGIALLMPTLGVIATGTAFLAMYVIYLPLVWLVARWTIGFRWSRAVKAQATLLMFAAVGIELSSRWSTHAGAATGLTLAIATGLWTLLRLTTMAGAPGRLGRIARIGERISQWMKR
ncbi:O-antigen translocase [Sedimentimonas flavescens]|uniref:O-antigen translocase n=1 Tax=Sedimentimonas flavescens TaxID=2851012 RepID=A0ABT2ZV97_9RHOB|nr:O-antigen translocase [Sedimentimonas flavescens]MCV2877673.1 O-antigen translocase [Sedimentimonas flavescens]